MAWWDDLEAPILGRYRLERLLGEGGMARVFLATDVHADRPVAFKTPKIEEFPPALVKELLARFNREFRSQASDPIQGVIPIYESGQFTDPEGVVRPFLAMQYLPGGSLGDLLGGTIGARAHRQTLAEVLDWLVPIARTIDRLHARKYLHRDVKPDNILFNSDGDPFLADFGIVGSLDGTLGGSTMAATGLGVLGSPGSPGYQSPESIQADAAARNVSASDQFSLAVTVYEALAGRLPVDAGTNQQWYGALMHWSPTPLSTCCPDMPSATSDAVMKAMSTQASGRFTTCGEFAKSLAASAAPSASAPPAPGSATTARQASPSLAATVSAREAPAPTRPAGGTSRARWTLALSLVAISTAGILAWRFNERLAPVTTDAPADTATNPREATLPARKGPDIRSCRQADGDGDGVDDCVDTCPASALGALVDGAGCARTLEGLQAVHFAQGSATLAADQLPRLDEAADFLKKNPDLIVNVTGHADESEGSAPVLARISEQRARNAVAYLESRGVRAGRLKAFGNSAFSAFGPAPGNRRAVVEPPPLPPPDPIPIPVPARWTICRAWAPSVDNQTLFHSTTEPMNVGPIPDWLDRARNEGAFRTVLQDAGPVDLAKAFVTCSEPAGTESAAKARFAALEEKLIFEHSRKFVLSYVDVPWRIRGTAQ